MNWTTPVIEEVACGMEINMYAADGDDGDGFPY
ncbi:pyrroloquinoline quinone precursor peptide PqqA [Rhodospirillum sp. A1_3_36]